MDVSNFQNTFTYEAYIVSQIGKYHYNSNISRNRLLNVVVPSLMLKTILPSSLSNHSSNFLLPYSCIFLTCSSYCPSPLAIFAYPFQLLLTSLPFSMSFGLSVKLLNLVQPLWSVLLFCSPMVVPFPQPCSTPA